MSDIAIRVENLGKVYRIGAQQERYKTLRDSLAGAVTGYLHRLRNPKSVGRDENTFWALKDVSFEVKRGEAVGIIGRNGAGKSTLLKILSRITEPTEGRVRLHGRVASLLEVGTGFHAELTGRENIYLNGAILGMKRTEIERKFDEIVAFAEIEKFLDTPVKRYSSGMYVRLAFAVAAHLEPEILLVDEVLAVGDAAFQNKCLGKMQQVAGEGRTVLFVSHNMAAVQKLCTRACLLDNGKVVVQEGVNEVVARYLGRSRELVHSWALADRVDRRGNGSMKFTKVTLLDRNENESAVIQSGEDVTIALNFEIRDQTETRAVIRLSFTDMYGQRLFMCLSRSSCSGDLKVPPSGRIRCKIPKLPLLPGSYNVSLWSKVDEQVADDIVDAFSIEVIGGDFFGTGRINPQDGGQMLVSHIWEVI
jgi:lipopolysaccharide transport system ATP-binding protein